VGGNVEVIVVAGVAGTFNLDVANVPATARGGAVLLSPNGSQAVAFTDGLRAGTTQFTVTVAEATVATTISPISTTSPTTSTSTGPGNPGTGTPGTPPPTTTTVATVPGVETVTNTLTTATTAETETTVTAAAAPESNFSNNLSELVSQGLISTLVTGTAGAFQSTSATSFVNTGPANGGTVSGAAASISASAGGNSGTNASNFLVEVENAIDEMFLHWREASDVVVNATRPYASGALDIVVKAVSPASNLLEAVGGKALMRTGLPWRDLLKVLTGSTGAVAEEFSRQLPMPQLKGVKATPPVAQPQPPTPEEEEEESLWEQDFTDVPLGDDLMWAGKETGLALLLVSGAYHASLRDRSEEEDDSRNDSALVPKA
jgi:hypothetical protein